MTTSNTKAITAPGLPDLNWLKLPPECRRPFEGENGRKSDRVGEREFEKLDAAIRSAEHPSWMQVRIRDYSLFGFGVHFNQGGSSGFVPLPHGLVELRISGLWNRNIVLPCEVRNIPTVGEGFRIGLKRLDLDGSAPAAKAPGLDALEFGPQSNIPVRIANPMLYREWGDAKLIGFGTANEWIFESEDSSLFLCKDLPLRMLFDLPLDSDGDCSGEILWTRAESEQRIVFGVKWTDMSFEISNAVGEHLLQSEPCTPSDLKPYGIQLRRFREQLRFSVVSTLEEYAKALDLRRHAYVHAGKVASTTTPEQLASKFDNQSRILAAFHGEEMVASLGLTFPRDESTRLKSEILFPDGRYPVPVPAKARMIEAHSFCTKREYRGGDLVRGVFEQVARCLLLSDRDWLITLTTGELWPLYRKIGFRKVGASVPVGYFGGLEHHLILLHRSSWICGKGMTVFAWNYFYGELIRDLIGKGYLEVTHLQSLRLFVNSIFGEASRKWAASRLEKEYKSFLDRVQIKGSSHG